MSTLGTEMGERALKKMIVMILLLSLTLVVLGCSTDQQSSLRLSDERIKELRKEYPLSDGHSDYALTIDVPFEQILKKSDSVIIAEVIKQNENFQSTLSTEPGTLVKSSKMMFINSIIYYDEE